MRFRSISIENVFSYAGKKAFHFNNDEQPITLIIGENGFGKTSFINTVKIALHGISKDILSIGTQTLSKSDFVLGSTTKHFSGLLNRQARANGQNKATIAIEIEDDDIFTIERQFLFEENSYTENLFLKDEDGTIFAEGEDAQDIINSKISPNMASFFFFDGEKIQTIADFSHAEFTKLLEDVLELDIYDSMAKDAEFLIKKLNKTELNAHMQEAVAKKEKELEQIATEIIATKEKFRHEKNVVLKELQRQQVAMSKKLKKLKNRYTESINQAVEKQNIITEEHKALVARFKTLTLVQLPLLLNNVLNDAVKQDISQNYRGKIQIDSKLLSEKKNELLALVLDNDNQIAAAFDQVFQAGSKSQSVAFADPYRVTKQFDALKKEKVDLASLLQALSKNKQESSAIAANLFEFRHKQELDGKEYADEIAREKELLTAIGRQESQCEALELKSIALVESEKALKSEYAKLTISEHKNNLLNAKIKTLRSIINVSHHMKQKIKTDKRLSLETEINRKFKKLKKEGYDADKIVLDEQFKINVFDKKGKAMDILSSSSGQKQIIATALIWGISEYIAEDIPMIIDTPLGRLDDKNQTLILNEFYPHASTQVIILPTPSELRHKGFKALQQHVADTFELQNSGSATTITHKNANTEPPFAMSSVDKEHA